MSAYGVETHFAQFMPAAIAPRQVWANKDGRRVYVLAVDEGADAWVELRDESTGLRTVMRAATLRERFEQVPLWATNYYGIKIAAWSAPESP